MKPPWKARRGTGAGAPVGGRWRAWLALAARGRRRGRGRGRGRRERRDQVGEQVLVEDHDGVPAEVVDVGRLPERGLDLPERDRVDGEGRLDQYHEVRVVQVRVVPGLV